MTANELDELRREAARLRRELVDADETLRAIRDGRVDAFVVGRDDRERVYALESIDGPYRILVERMQQGAVTIAADGAILYANGQASALLGAPRERLVGRAFRDFVAAADQSLFSAVIASEIDDPQGEIRLERGDGTRVPVYLSAGPLSPGEGADVCLLISDLTRQKQHEELIAAETLARSMLEQAADAVVVCDPGGLIVHASPAAHEICGRNPLRQPFADVFPLTLDGPSRLAVNGRFDVSRLDDRVRGLEASLPSAGGSRARLLLSAGPVTDGNGAPLGSVVTLADIGALKRAEDELKEADRRKDEFLAVLAHELRNPLAPIVSGLEVLRLAGEGAQMSSPVLGMMERQVEHLVRLVDDLLEISRITRGKIELRKETIDFGDVVASAIDTSRAFIEAANHAFEVDVPSEPIRLEADGVRLAQVIANLLSNAAKYTPPGGDISLTARVENAHLVVRVRDTGNGIPAELLDDVFTMFVQSRRSSRLHTGLGIGLALVRSLVEMHGGSVSAASDGIDQGSEFTVRLPLGAATAGDLAAGAGPGDEALAALERVLVVDDNRDSANSLGLLLEIMGCEVTVAYDGPSALACLDGFQPEAIFLDIGMPGMDGHEVARRIRQRGGFEDVVLVAVTGWGQEHDRACSRDAGFDHHLLKPVEIDVLRALLVPARAD